MWPKGNVPRGAKRAPPSYNVAKPYGRTPTPAELYLPCDVCGASVQASELDPKATRVLCLTHRHGDATTGDRPMAYCERCTRRAKGKPNVATGVYRVEGEAFGNPWKRLMSLCGACGMEAHAWTYFAPCPECEGYRKSGARPHEDINWRIHMRSGLCRPAVGRYVTKVTLLESGSEVAALWLRRRMSSE